MTYIICSYNLLLEVLILLWNRYIFHDYYFLFYFTLKLIKENYLNVIFNVHIEIIAALEIQFIRYGNDNMKTMWKQHHLSITLSWRII